MEGIDDILAVLIDSSLHMDDILIFFYGPQYWIKLPENTQN